jgi:hypothetical protein
MKQKQCCRCNVVKPVSKFHSHGYYKTKAGRVKIYKPDCKVCANKKWGERLDNQLALLIEEWKCSVCGYARCKHALEFHHVDGTHKDFIVSARWTISFEKLKNEIAKCVLLCANCHREVHAGLIKLE